jgi:hypothetical protein
MLAASCSSGSESVPTTSATESVGRPPKLLRRSSPRPPGSLGESGGWVIITETLTLAERIADALGGTAG